MKVVVAIDSFKGSVSSLAAGNAVRDGILAADPDTEVTVFSVADGGEGTCDALMQGVNGSIRNVCVHGPLGKLIDAGYGISSDGKTAVIEMASAAGLPLVPIQDRNPLKTTTFGVGEMILDALELGCRRFLLGIGGSATNDGGVGMLRALGFSFLDEKNAEIPLGGIGLKSLCRIDAKNVDPRLQECDFHIAVDVDNPLCGENGCSYVFAPQKGADETTVKQMDRWLMNYARLTKEIYPKADENACGVGAAGGMGFACVNYLGAKLDAGITLVLDEIGIEDSVKSCDVVVTGEGRLDAQSVRGKTPVGIAALGKKYGKTVIAFSGCLGKGAELCNQYGIDAYFSILSEPNSLEETMRADVTLENLRRTACQCFRLLATQERICNEL